MHKDSQLFEKLDSVIALMKDQKENGCNKRLKKQ